MQTIFSMLSMQWKSVRTQNSLVTNFFKIASFVFARRKKVIHFWNDIRASKWWQYLFWGGLSIIKNVKNILYSILKDIMMVWKYCRVRMIHTKRVQITDKIIVCATRWLFAFSVLSFSPCVIPETEGKSFPGECVLPVFIVCLVCN